MKTKARALMAAILSTVGLGFHAPQRELPASLANNPEQYVPMRRRRGKGKFNKAPFKMKNGGIYHGVELAQARYRNGVGRPPEKHNERQAEQMNRMHDEWWRAKQEREAAAGNRV